MRIDREAILFDLIPVEVTCQRSNGGCDQVCTDAEIGVNCSCKDGYQLANEQTCTGSYTSYSNIHMCYLTTN